MINYRQVAEDDEEKLDKTTRVFLEKHKDSIKNPREISRTILRSI
mgnify:CR=1 FL=1